MSGTIPARDAANGVRAASDVITDVGEPHNDDEQLTRGRRRPPSPLVLALWIGIPMASAVWVGITANRYYPVFDEWVMIDRATSGSWLREMFIGFNGHLWSLAYWVYHLQLHLGVESSWFVYLVLVASLVALQLSVAGVLYRLGLPAVVALLAATVVAYFGRASENMVLEQQFAANFALAFSCAAAFVVLRERRDRSGAIVVAVLLVAALFCDSGIALVGLLFPAALLLFLWPFRLARIALVPPVIGHVLWFALDRSEVLVHGVCQNCRSVTFEAPLVDRIEFAWAILVRSAGGLVGGYATAGVVVLVAGFGCVGLAAARHRLSRAETASVVGGALAALAAVVSLSYSPRASGKRSTTPSPRSARRRTGTSALPRSS